MAGSEGEGRPPGDGVPNRRPAELIVGRLVGHGAAPYQGRTEEGPSYYMKLLTSRGPRVLWGKDLERALTEGATLPKEGDIVGARRQARQTVTVTQRVMDERGEVVSSSNRQAHRAVWQVERVSYFAERARLARQVREDQTYDKDTIKKNPELRSSFLSIRAAEEFAKAKIPNPEDRERFMILIRGALSDSIHQGAPIPNVKLKDRAPSAKIIPLHKKPEEPTR